MTEEFAPLTTPGCVAKTGTVHVSELSWKHIDHPSSPMRPVCPRRLQARTCAG